MIRICDMNGKTLSQGSIVEHGKAEFTASGCKYSHEMYNYPLIADNLPIDAKQTVLTK
ncbi:MAG: hypothetical protein ACK5KP_02075 [Paludibacteraceae bacterium]